MTKQRARPADAFTMIGRPLSSHNDRSLARERIASDLEAFRRDGGEIEKLGNTRTMKHLDFPTP